MDMSGFDAPGFSDQALAPSQANQQAVQVMKKKVNPLMSWIPAVGAIGGGVLGSLIAPGVGTAVGGAGGAMAGQKLEDWLTGQHTSLGGYAEQGALGTLGGVGKGLEAARGGLTALKGGEGLDSVINSLRYGSRGAVATAGNGGSLLDNTLTATQANRTAGPITKGIQNEANQFSKSSLLSQVGQLNKGTAESAVRDAQGIKDLGYSSISKAASHAPSITGNTGLLTAARNELVNDPAAKGIDTSNFLQSVKDTLGSHVQLTDPENKNILSRITSIADKYNFQGSPDTMLQHGSIGIAKASDINGAMKEVMDMAYKAAPNSAPRQALTDIGNNLRGGLTDSLSTVPLTGAMKEGIVDQLKLNGISQPKLFTAIRGAQTASDLSSIESKFVTASNMAQDATQNALRYSALRPGEPGITQMANKAAGQIVGRPIQIAASKGADLISNAAGKIGSKEVPTSIPQVISQNAKSMIKAQVPARLLINGAGNANSASQQPDFSNPQTALGSPDATGMDPNAATPQAPTGPDPTSPGVSGYSDQELQSGIANAVQAGDIKSATEIQNLLKLNQSGETQSASSQKNTAAQAQQINATNDAFGYINGIEQQFKSFGGMKGPIAGQLTKVPVLNQFAFPSQTAYNQTKIDAVSAYVKAITGNSRPSFQQISLYMHSFPDVTDTPKVAAQKLANLRLQLKNKAQNDLAYPSTGNSAGTSNLTDIINSLTNNGFATDPSQVQFAQ
jgi:hypothetical protein